MNGRPLVLFACFALGLGVAPSFAAGRSPGSALQASSGVVIEEVDPDTAASAAGLRAGDRIIAVNGEHIASYNDLDPLIAGSKGRPLIIDIDRVGAHLRLKAAPRMTTALDEYGILRTRLMLGIAHTEMRLMLVPGGDDDDDDSPPFIDGSE